MKSDYKQTESGAIPQDWEVSSFGTMFNISAGGDVDPKRSRSYRDEIHRYPIYSNALVDRGLYGFCSYSDHPAGSITVTARGMVGAANFRDHAYTAIGRVLVLDPKNEISGRYFSEVINNRVVFANESTGVPQLTAPQIAKYQIPVPPLAEQHAIAEVLCDADALLEALDRLLAKKRDLKKAAMGQLLSGQVRLPGFHGEWKTGQLGSFVRTHNSGIYKKSDSYGRGANIIGVSDLYEIDCIDGQSFSQVPLSSDEQAKYTLEAHDLLYGESSLVREGIARTVYVTERGAGTAFAWHTRRYRVDQEVLRSSFLYYYLQGRRARKYMMDQSIQTAITGINTVAYFGCPISIPAIPEQVAIAEVLSEMDAELAGLEQRRAKICALKQGIMQELLTGRTRLISLGFSNA